MSSNVGLAIKAALERAEMHQTVTRRMRVRFYCHFGEGHHAPGLVIKAWVPAGSNAELMAGRTRTIPWAELDRTAARLPVVVDELVAEVEAALGIIASV